MSGRVTGSMGRDANKPKTTAWICWNRSSIRSLAGGVNLSSLVGGALRSERAGDPCAVWLAERVGESGQVVATDIDVTYLKRLNLPNVEVRQHNILDDPLEALGPGSFDLVSSRLMLFWLAGKQEEAIRRMVECLRPGGWLVDEDGDWGTIAPVDPSHPYYARYNEAWRDGEWWVSRGYDPAFGRKLPVLFEHCGLENIRHEATAEVVRGGSSWARWWQETLEAIRTWEQAGGGLTEAQEEDHRALTAPWRDPSFWFLNALLHACWGQRARHEPTPLGG